LHKQAYLPKDSHLKEKIMEYLPLVKDGVSVHAGLWKRPKAMIVDALICIPCWFILDWLKRFDLALAITITITSTILFQMYFVYFNAKFGGTPGKLVTGIRVTLLDGARIGWIEAWKRESVNIVWAFYLLVSNLWAICHVDPTMFYSLRPVERSQLLYQCRPSWGIVIDKLGMVWILSEVIVFLLNKRKRAIHDFIAGTVVIRKEFTASTGVVTGSEEG
jgi:uncharacterized RDD family membrane protein YckC